VNYEALPSRDRHMHNQDHGHSGSLGTIPQNFWDSAKINMPDTPTRTAEGIHIHPLDSLNRETGRGDL